MSIYILCLYNVKACSAVVGGGEQGEAAGERPLPPHHYQVLQQGGPFTKNLTELA